MKLSMDTAVCYVPGGETEETALARITHLGVGAHPDDLEFMAFHGILACYEHDHKWFGGVTCANGAGSARTAALESCSNHEVQAIRRQEQNRAADIGEYGVMIQLDFPSTLIQNAADPRLESDLVAILKATRPDVVYTHNPADKHDTHIAVVVNTIRALRTLPLGERPGLVLGCEVWRGLDWMMDTDKVVMDVSANETLAHRLNGVFTSQIHGGKRYDLATMGRRRANATFLSSHAVDDMEQCWFAMDLTPLIQDDDLDLAGYVMEFVTRFAEDVQNRLSPYPASNPARQP